VRSPSSSKRRPDQVGEVIRQVVAEAILRDLRDPRIKLVTVTRVDVSGDLSHARVYVIGHDEAAQDQAVVGLASAAGFLRSRVAKALATRIVPDLTFVVDRGVEHAARIDEILAGLRRGKEEA